MATLVLSTVGTVLGGPIGGAIGALIGQSVDQQLLGPSSRGPRLGDLSIQSSSYGTQVPRIYGSMRVAGSVVWSTDLVESEQTTGAKGQPDATYSYSVSFAVALSSRRVASVGRIWADGKLLRGAEGDFKVSTTFRFYDGNEDQTIDPLIGSIEGIATTPAYRGLALAIFENLELAEFGNRIPFLTFELIADDETPSLGLILPDASGGAIAGDHPDTVVGYAAYGRSIRAALEPLTAGFDVNLFDDGMVLRPASGGAQPIRDSELGNSADNRPGARLERVQEAARSLPAVLRLGYYDPARDYQSAEARASAGEQSGNEEQQELPAVLMAGDGKSLAQQMLARRWARRDLLSLRLAPSRLNLEPGTVVELSLSSERWMVEKCTIEAFVAVVELRQLLAPIAAVSADAGRIVANHDVVAEELSLALLDVPMITDQSSSEPTLLLAASTPTLGWKRRNVQIEFAGHSMILPTARRKAVMGRALTQLGDGEAHLIDTQNSVEVELVDGDQWLVSCDDEALVNGSNLAVVGRELIQFGMATANGPGRFRLERLLRGRAGTEWAAALHVSNEPFVLVERDALQHIGLPRWVAASQVSASAGNSSASAVVSGEALKPLAPVALRARILENGDLDVTWTRRSRRGWAWIDELDAPIGETREEYRVTITGMAGTIERATQSPDLIVALSDLSSIGTGPATIDVRQVGDWAVSRPSQLSINLS